MGVVRDWWTSSPSLYLFCTQHKRYLSAPLVFPFSLKIKKKKVSNSECFFCFFLLRLCWQSRLAAITHTHNDLQKSKYGLKQLDEWKKTGSESHMVIDKQLTHHDVQYWHWSHSDGSQRCKKDRLTIVRRQYLSFWSWDFDMAAPSIK